MKKKKIKFFLKLAVTLGFVAWIIFGTDWKEFFFYLREIKIIGIFLYIIVLIIGMIISSYRWKLLAEVKKINFSLKEYFTFYLTGTFINNFMPSFIAGDAYKTYGISGPEKKYFEAASSVMMDRITGLIGAMILALVFSLLNLKNILTNKILIITNIILILSFGIDFLIAKMRKINFLKNWVYKIMPEKITLFLKETYSYSNEARVVVKAVILSIIFSFVGVALLNLIVFWSLGINVNLLNYLSVIFIISVVSALPISINNIGLKEWAYMTFFGIFGINPSAALTVAVVSRLLQMGVSFFALPAYLKARKN